MNLLRIVIAVVIAVVWAVVYTASVFNPDINAPPELSGVMLAVVTWLFGATLRESFKDRARAVAKAVLDDDKGKSEDKDNDAVDPA